MYEAEILTTKLSDGTVVLAKMTKYGVSAYQYFNRTQAYKKQQELGPDWQVVSRGRPFYIARV